MSSELPPSKEQLLAETLQSLEDLSFACFSGFGLLNRPPIDVYNRTFNVLKRVRDQLGVNTAAEYRPALEPPAVTWPQSKGDPIGPVWSYGGMKGMYQAEALRMMAHDLVERIKWLEAEPRAVMRQAQDVDGVDTFALIKALHKTIDGQRKHIATLEKKLLAALEQRNQEARLRQATEKAALARTSHEPPGVLGEVLTALENVLVYADFRSEEEHASFVDAVQAARAVASRADEAIAKAEAESAPPPSSEQRCQKHGCVITQTITDDVFCGVCRAAELQAEVDRLNALINTPHTHDFIEAVKLEMPHQRERWGAEHDAGKSPADWFWLVGYLTGKALQALIGGNIEKGKHHVITSAAALGNWFLAITGESTSMRPGIVPPSSETKSGEQP